MKEFLNKLKFWRATWLHKRKVKQRAKAAVSVCEMFTLSERNGEVYVLCDGLPICKLSQHFFVEEVISELEKHRKDALNYYQLPEIYLPSLSRDRKCP